jgi:DNA-binding MarR family transcriptional regulator
MPTGRALRKSASETIPVLESDARRDNAAADPHASDPWNAAIDEGRKLDLAEYPSGLLLRVANVIHQESTGSYAKKHGLSVPEWRILGRLCESAPMRLTTLCRVSHFDKAQATRVLQTLSARRLVRTFADPAHKHRRIVDITPSGRKLAESVFPEAVAEQLKLLRTLSPEERRTTFNVLRKLLAIYGTEIPAPAATYKDYPS